MKILHLLLCLIPIASAVKGTPQDIQRKFLALPKCGIQCTLPALLELKCNLLDPVETAKCLCQNIPMERKVSNCVLANCTYEELVQIETLQYELCHDEPRPSRRGNLMAVTVVLTVITTLMVALRCWSRYTISKQFWWDDWFILFSLATFLAVQANNFWGISMGFGVHVWNVNPDLNVKLYQYEYLYQILYTIATLTTKMSVVLLYYRIFPQRWLHKTIWFFLVAESIVFSIFFFLVVFQCNPLAAVFDKTIKGKCLDFRAIILAGAILSTVEDVVIICLPIPSILKLRLKARKKVEVILIMSVGMIAVVCSLVRMKYVVAFNYSIDINWDDFYIAVLTMIELSMSITCVCFPAVKLLLNRIWPRSFPSDEPPQRVEESMQVNLSGVPTSESQSWVERMKASIGLMLGASWAHLPGSLPPRSRDWSEVDPGSPLESLPCVNQDTLAGTVNRSVERMRFDEKT